MKPDFLPPVYPEAVGHDACGTGFLADRTGKSRGDIVALALTALARMDHRGGVGADGETGDGAGLLTAIPWAVLVSEEGNGIHADMADRAFGVGSIFLPRDGASGMQVVEKGLKKLGLKALAWREVPTNDAVLGRLGLASRPGLSQVVVSRPHDPTDDQYEQKLLIARREIDALGRELGLDDLYVASLSHRTIVYKALLRGSQLREFYNDLRHPEYRTPYAVFHNRYSTNTRPSWPRTQPFRQVAHNGEINTVEGNRRWMEARGRQGAGASLGFSKAASLPFLAPNESDSASLDEAFRLLTAAGHTPYEAWSILVSAGCAART